MLKGWKCPVCGRVYGPFVRSCQHCNGKIDKKIPATPIRHGVWRPTREQNEELRKIETIWVVYEVLMV